MSADKANITHRLRTWTHAVDAVAASDLMDEAAAEIDRLREAIRRIAEQDATLSVQGGNVTIDITNDFVEAFGGPLMPFDPPQPLTLTDAERQAIREAADAYALNDDDPDCERIERALRGLLERLG